MAIKVTYLSGTQPGPGTVSFPLHTGKPPLRPSLPFGQKSPINNWTGKHIPLHRGKAAKAAAIALDDLTDTDVTQDSTDEAPRPSDGDIMVYDVISEKWKAATAVDLTAEDPGENVVVLGADKEGSEIPSLDTWTAGGDNGLEKWTLARVVYNHEGNKVLYELFRKEVYDKYGRLYSVNVEKRIVVDTAEAC